MQAASKRRSYVIGRGLLAFTDESARDLVCVCQMILSARRARIAEVAPLDLWIGQQALAAV